LAPDSSRHRCFRLDGSPKADTADAARPRRRGDRVTRFRYLPHLLRSPIGTWPTRSDVRDYGEYWRVSGPCAKCSGLGWPSCGYPSFVDYIPNAGRSDAVAVGGVADHLRLPSDRGTWPSKLAAMIMRRVGRVNSCHRPLPGYNERARRRGCGSAGTHQIRKGDQPENRCCICSRPLVARSGRAGTQQRCLLLRQNRTTYARCEFFAF
jgi:hypothetical protein